MTKCYTVQTDCGMNIFEAANAKEARDEALDEVGRNQIKSITESTDEELQWCYAMSGDLPEAGKKRLKIK